RGSAVYTGLIVPIRQADRQGQLRGRGLSRVQTLALEILMLWEDVREQRNQRYQFKLGLLGQDPAQVKAMFASEFGDTSEVNTDEATDEEIDQIIDQEIEGAASE